MKLEQIAILIVVKSFSCRTRRCMYLKKYKKPTVTLYMTKLYEKSKDNKRRTNVFVVDFPVTFRNLLVLMLCKKGICHLS